MNKKKIIAIVAAVLVIALLAGCSLIRPEAQEGMKSFTLTIVHADGASKDMALKSDAEYLGEFLQDEGIITGEEGAYGLYIKEVDGEKAVYEEDNAYWAFYVGEEYATLGIDLTPITDGAVYKLVYTPADAMG